MPGYRCRHAFETVCVHANGDVVCSIIDGRGDFVLGNVHSQSIDEIFRGPRYAELRQLVLSTDDGYCRAIGKRCPLKTVPVASDGPPDASTIRFLQIEPTTACDLRCLCCPVRDFSARLGWQDAYRDGGVQFLVWDSARRLKQHAADAVAPLLGEPAPLVRRTRIGALLRRGRMPHGRTGTLPIEAIRRVIDGAGDAVERVDFYNYGEPFLYRHLIDALRYTRTRLPSTTIAISTDGMQVREAVQHAIVSERLLDWLIFSVDGCDAESYDRYRIGGRFETAFANLQRFHRAAVGSGIHVIWQYVVFRWNDSDDQLRRALAMADAAGIRIWFEFAHTWGRSRRRPEDLEYVRPFLKPHTQLPRTRGTESHGSPVSGMSSAGSNDATPESPRHD